MAFCKDASFKEAAIAFSSGLLVDKVFSRSKIFLKENSGTIDKRSSEPSSQQECQSVPTTCP
jgi:hypothetical protein